MNRVFIIVFSLITINAFGQKSPTERANPIVEEGKLLYNSEIASWYGTDLFLECYTDSENIGGYLSYTAVDTVKCVFFSMENTPKVIGTISFDLAFNINTAKTELVKREFTTIEKDLYILRMNAISEINSDTLFKSYSNTQFNLIPLINGEEKKVYILTGPKQAGVIIFGNDYLLTFDKKNKLISKKQLHKNIIPFSYDNEGDKLDKLQGSTHNHSAETGDFITATDICTLMLYSKLAKWKTHHVVSKKYLNIWHCETNQLTVVPLNVHDKFFKD